MSESADFLNRLRGQVEQSGNTGQATSRVSEPVAKRPPRSKHVVQTNQWDDRGWHRAMETNLVKDLVGDLRIGDKHKGGERAGFDPALELAEGVFQSAYKALPRLKDKRDIEKSHYPVRQIIEEILSNPTLKNLQAMTVGDVAMATIATQAMGDELCQILARTDQPQDGQPDPDQQDGEQGEQGQPGEGQDQGQPGEQGDEQGTGSGDAGQGDQEFDPDAEDDDGLEEGEADWQEQWDDALGEGNAERLANKAIEAAQDEVEELDSARRGVGMEDGEWRSMSPDERLKIVEQLRTPQMRTLAKIIGRMRRFALGVKAQRIIDVPHEPYDVEKGNDIRRVLQSEFALLATKETSWEFYRKYAEGELLLLKKRGSEEVGKGPIVCCIDKSTSMRGAPLNWALAVAEALRRFAAEEDRDMFVMFFGRNSDRVRFEFPKGKAPIEKVLTFLGTVADGGTEFDGVLTEALKRAQEQFDGAGKGKADIVFITDGMANLSESWIKGFNEERRRVGVRMYSIYIGGASDTVGKGGPLGLLQSISEACIPVSELRPSAVETVFQRV